jgi:LysM repeat protein
MQPHEKFQFKTHRVKKGETLKRIAKLYRVDLEPLLEINHLKEASRVLKGMTLFIPIAKDEKNKNSRPGPEKKREGSKR